jgi:endogenous inhibitor of DNA gyrase (YacG/DUF329 family)
MSDSSKKQRFFISDTVSIGQWSWDKLKCIVCNLPIRENQQKLFCPYCGNSAHRTHLLEWIKIKGFCPYCRKNLRRKDLVGE